MEDFKLEKAVEKLEKIVEVLESGEIPLDEALKKYEEGVKLARLCNQKLAQAEKRIEVLTRQLSGQLVAEPFNPEEEEKSIRKKTKSKKESQPSEDAGSGEESDEDTEGLLF